MANTKSAKKAIRVAKRRSVINLRLKRALKTSTKEVKKAVVKGGDKDLNALLKQAYKDIDKAAKKNLIHKNAAARYKSNVAKAVNKVA
jgi:small subunit ribosomal protein S20